jgi:hypothetical protein
MNAPPQAPAAIRALSRAASDGAAAVAAEVAALGGKQVFINTGPRADYPAPAATYLAAGFEVVSRGQVYGRRAP